MFNNRLINSCFPFIAFWFDRFSELQRLKTSKSTLCALYCHAISTALQKLPPRQFNSISPKRTIKSFGAETSYETIGFAVVLVASLCKLKWNNTRSFFCGVCNADYFVKSQRYTHKNTNTSTLYDDTHATRTTNTYRTLQLWSWSHQLRAMRIHSTDRRVKKPWTLVMCSFDSAVISSA